jgi:hypothetical protein
MSAFCAGRPISHREGGERHRTEGTEGTEGVGMTLSDEAKREVPAQTAFLL